MAGKYTEALAAGILAFAAALQAGLKQIAKEDQDPTDELKTEILVMALEVAIDAAGTVIKAEAPGG